MIEILDVAPEYKGTKAANKTARKAAQEEDIVVEYEEIEDYETPLGLPQDEEELPEFDASNMLTDEDLPENAQLLAEILDELNENRIIEVYISSKNETINFGDEVTLYAILRGYDDCVFTAQWQISDDDANYTDIAGENNLACSFIVTEQNYTKYWRIVTTITAVNVPDELLNNQD